VEKMMLQQTRDDEIGRATAEGRARLLLLRKVSEKHKAALAKGQMMTEDEMTAGYDAAMEAPPPAGAGAAKQVQDDTVFIALMNPIGVTVVFEIGEGADKVAGQIQPRGRVIFRFKKIQATLHAKVAGDTLHPPISQPIFIERNTFLQFALGVDAGTRNRLYVFDKTSEMPAAAAGSMGPPGTPVPPTEVKRGVMPPPGAPQPK
jgi:hypothetical protein